MQSSWTRLRARYPDTIQNATHACIINNITRKPSRAHSAPICFKSHVSTIHTSQTTEEEKTVGQKQHLDRYRQNWEQFRCSHPRVQPYIILAADTGYCITMGCHTFDFGLHRPLQMGCWSVGLLRIQHSTNAWWLWSSKTLDGDHSTSTTIDVVLLWPTILGARLSTIDRISQLGMRQDASYLSFFVIASNSFVVEH